MNYHDMMRNLLEKKETTHKSDVGRRNYRFRPNIFRDEYMQSEGKS